MKFLKRTLAATVLFIVPGIFPAQNNFPVSGQLNVLTPAANFLRIAPDARAGGMGETGVASSPDIYSMHWNAAKYAFAEKRFGAGVSYTPWLRALAPGIDHTYLSLYMKPDSVSAIAASARYFSLGTITATGPGGVIGQYKPTEMAFDLGYSRRIAKYWSLGAAFRYIRSDLSNGIFVSQDFHAGQSFAFDLAGYYIDRDRVKIFGRPGMMTMGASLTNIGSKIRYKDSTEGEFIPINLGIGQGFGVDLNSHNSISLQYELNKLLVPTPPLYAIDSLGNRVLNSSGQYVIEAGKDPNVSVPKGMLQSFNDAPGGAREEFSEINFAIGAEYAYNKTFFVRTGYFYEAKRKGNRQFVTLGAGVKFNFASLDFAYLIPTNGQRSPLQNTLRFSLQFQFDHFKKSPPVRRHNVGF
jgi:hypothetical protein